MGIRDNFRRAVEELQGESRPEPRSAVQRRRTFMQRPGYEEYAPPKDDMQEYWRAFETVPFVRQSITAFAREVVEPGWWIETENDELAEELAEWLREAAIVEGETERDFALLLKKVVIQREVRGTALVEHVPDGNDPDSIAALKLINPETVTTFTKPNTSVLLEPDDDAIEDLDDDIPLTEDNEVPAYVQFYRQRFDQDPVPFTKDQITKVTRDADVGEVYGTSKLEAVLPRIKALRKKLHDKDQAIENKAWPVWIFQFGSEEDPWHPDDIDDFMEEEDEDNFSPGTKHGVQGDISVDTVGGDIPEIEESINYDVNHIISALPMPKFATGFAEDINQFVSQQQENRIRRQVKEARRELEYEFKTVLKMKAEEMGYNVEDEEFHIRITPPEGEDPNELYEAQGTTIRYVSDVDDDSDEPVTNQFDPDYEASNDSEDSNGSSDEESSDGDE